MKRELLDRGWLANYGQEATALGLTKAECEMCKSLGITPQAFADSKKNLGITEDLVEGNPDSLVDAARANAPLTPEQIKMCLQLGITTDEFRSERAKLAVASLT
jgi:hypothetical protein